MVTPSSKEAIESILQMSFPTYEAALSAWSAAYPYTPPPAPTSTEEYTTQADTTQETINLVDKTVSKEDYFAANPDYTIGTQTEVPPLNLEVAPTPIGEQDYGYVEKDFSFAAIPEPLQFGAGAARSVENIIGPILQPFIHPLTGYEYKSDIYEPATFRAGKALGTIGIATGGGVIGEKMAIDRTLTESIFIGEEFSKGGFTYTKGTVSTKQPRYFGLGKKEIAQTQVLLKQQVTPVGTNTFKVQGLGRAGENLITTRSVVGTEGDLVASAGVVKSYSPRGIVTTSEATGVGRNIEGSLVTATRGDGNIIGVTSRISPKPSTTYTSGGIDTATAVDRSISSTMAKTTSKPATTAFPSITTSSARTRPDITTSTYTPTRQELRQNVMVSPIQDKAYRQQTAIRTAKIPQPRLMPMSTAIQAPKQKPKQVPIVDVTPAQMRDTTPISLQRQPAMQETVPKITPIPLDRPITSPSPRLKAPPIWDMNIRIPSSLKRNFSAPRTKPRRTTRYTPSVAAWAGNIRRKVTRAERKAKFTGFEVRPIPLDNVPKRRKKKRR